MPKAIRYARYGDPEVMTLDDVEMPVPAAGEVRIAIRASGVNAIDWKIRRGLLANGEAMDEPAGVGMEVAGVVDAVGPGVHHLNRGQAVFGQVPSGAAATHVLAAAERLIPKPEWLSFEQAAALPVAVETADRTLRQLDIRSGQTLLIHAVAGGVGLSAAQLARARGADVVGTASEPHHPFLRELGVRPATYGDGWAERVTALAPHGVDAVLDASGRGVLPQSVELTGDPGMVITIADTAAEEQGVRFSTSADGKPLPDVFANVLPLVERGELSMPIAATFPLERAADAHRLSERGHLLGKIVIVVPQPHS
ncbi:NADP-dependent oxidoreductase [Actinobacteria bacterium YIM 96077]|uniref:NADP-dependent oxidoreductase n=1 Tax=Phytoactinopolyspora halophila TaxID=1981511 RepID=A0A329R3G1_9ACTN|nr:NADP-dependent oxidoreductase [Phytoactinopolyspora halophila]AYY12208.1 NADP-dependent oxidoreductase [Actinobacteria bacterium YIM 96077]RAW18559.1 NADP-dependent oxidoreductase [Phytoactinopolyspora halophila]